MSIVPSLLSRGHAPDALRWASVGDPRGGMPTCPISPPRWSLGHQHADGLRIMSKAILKDLWLAAREIHNA